jgi:hypothetical protein
MIVWTPNHIKYSENPYKTIRYKTKFAYFPRQEYIDWTLRPDERRDYFGVWFWLEKYIVREIQHNATPNLGLDWRIQSRRRYKDAIIDSLRN